MAEIARAARTECAIERDEEEWPDEAVVVDGYANRVFGVPNTWSDDQIWVVFGLFNQAYREGFDQGAGTKAAEVRRAIGARPALHAIGTERPVSGENDDGN